MNQHWKQFLKEQLGEKHNFIESESLNQEAVANEVITDQASIQDSKASLKNNFFCDLSHQDIVSVSGPDALTFLQGQLSCDLEEVTVNKSQLGACCNLKGRIISNFIVCFYDSSYLLIAPKGMGDVISTVLKKYAVFSKVTIETSSDDRILLGFKQINDLDKTDHKGLSKIQWPNDEQRGFLIGDVQTAMREWPDLIQSFQAFGKNAWDLTDINAGLAFISKDISEEFTPQAVNFDLVGGINFSKGCYTGQEVIARLHYRGKTKRRAFIAVSNSQQELMAPGDEIVNEQNKSIGEVLQSAWDENGSCKALISIPIDKSQDKSLSIKSKQNSVLTIFSPPYDLPQ